MGPEEAAAPEVEVAVGVGVGVEVVAVEFAAEFGVEVVVVEVEDDAADVDASGTPVAGFSSQAAAKRDVARVRARAMRVIVGSPSSAKWALDRRNARIGGDDEETTTNDNE
jgi:hypothetical protein